MGGECGSGRSMLAAWHNDDDLISVCMLLHTAKMTYSIEILVSASIKILLDKEFSLLEARKCFMQLVSLVSMEGAALV